MRTLLGFLTLGACLTALACQAPDVGSGPRGKGNGANGDGAGEDPSEAGLDPSSPGGGAGPGAGSAPATPNQPGTPGSAAAGFRVITPVRLVDSRDGTGAAKGAFVGALESNVERAIDISGLDGPLGPAATRVALQLNVVALEAPAPGFLRVYPCGTAPDVSTVNFQAGEVIAGTALVDAKSSFCVLSNVATKILVDATGAFETGANLRFTPAAPVRIFDSRQGAKAASYTIPVAGAAGVIAHLTITEPTVPGFARVFPCGTPEPSTSNINFAANETIATSTTVATSNGSLCVSASTDAHVIVDLEGSLGSGGKIGFVPRTPTRIHDSRAAGGPSTAFRVPVPNFAPGMTTAALHLTGVESLTPGFIGPSDCNGAAPATSAVNFGANQARTSLSFVPVSADGFVCLTASTPVQLIADLVGVLMP